MMALRTGSWPRARRAACRGRRVDGVEERRAAAGAQLVDAGFKSVLVVGPVLGDRGRHIEAHDEGAVAFGLEHLEQKLGGRLLLKLEAGADGGAGVDDDAHAQRQIDLLVKRVDLGRRLLVVEQRKVALLQVGNVVAVLVGDGEDEVDFIDADMDGRRAVSVFDPGPGAASGAVERGCLRCGLSGRLGRRGSGGGRRLLSERGGAGATANASEEKRRSRAEAVD
jgi:hypothetical protein